MKSRYCDSMGTYTDISNTTKQNDTNIEQQVDKFLKSRAVLSKIDIDPISHQTSVTDNDTPRHIINEINEPELLPRPKTKRRRPVSGKKKGRSDSAIRHKHDRTVFLISNYSSSYGNSRNLSIL